MNSIIDLNAASTRTFNQQNDYNISFNADAGNATVEMDAFDTHALAKQTPLSTVTSAVRDILIDVQFANFPTPGSLNYVGPFGNIGVQQINNTTWRVSGIRDVNRYNEAFANVRVRDTGISNSYSYTTQVNDQTGNTRNWSTLVTVRDQPVVNVTGPVLFTEDTLANISTVNIGANAASTATYVLTATAITPFGDVSNTTTTGSTVTVTGNAVAITDAITSGNLKYLPAPDLAANVVGALNFKLSINNNLISQANANVEVGAVSSEFTLGTSLNYSEDVAVNMVSSIVDVDTTANSYTVRWQQTEPSVTSDPGEFSTSTVNGGWGNVLSITSSKAELNATTVQYTPPADFTGNITLTYTQTKLGRDGRVYMQANAVPVNLTNTATHAEFASLDFDYYEMYDNPLPIEITDLELAGQYTSNVIAVSNSGNLNRHKLSINGVPSSDIFNGVSTEITRQGTKAALNAQSITFRANSSVQLGNVEMAYQQVKTSAAGLTYNQTANTVTINGDAVTAHMFTARINTTPRFNIVNSYTYDEDQYFRLSNTSELSESPYFDGSVTSQHPDAGNAALTAFRVTFQQVFPDPAVTPGYFGFDAPVNGNQAVRDYFMAGKNGQVPGNIPHGQGQIEHFGNLVSVGRKTTTNNFIGPGTMFLPPPNYTGNIEINYTQQQINLATGEVVVQANAVPITMTVANTHSEFSSIANVSATTVRPVKFNDALNLGVNSSPIVTILDQDSADIKRYNIVATVESGRLYGDFLYDPTGNGGNWNGDGSLSISTKTGQPGHSGVDLTTAKFRMAAINWVPEQSGNSNISVQITSSWPTTTGFNTVEIANVSIPVNVTQTSVGDLADGGFFAGNCIVADGFDAGDYYLIVDKFVTTQASFAPPLADLQQVYPTLEATSTNDGLSATTYLDSLDVFIQPARIARERISAGTGNVAAAQYKDWYVASFDEADQIIRVIGTSGLNYSGPWWTSTVTSDNQVKLINGDRTTTLVSLPTGDRQERFLMVRRIDF